MTDARNATASWQEGRLKRKGSIASVLDQFRCFVMVRAGAGGEKEGDRSKAL